MQYLMDRLFALYGSDAVLVSGNTSKKMRIFFQSVNSRSWQNMERVYIPLGRVPRGQYVCILPAGTAKEGDVIKIGSKSYRICRLEEITVRTGTVYLWGLCNEKGGEDTWGSTS